MPAIVALSNSQPDGRLIRRTNVSALTPEASTPSTSRTATSPVSLPPVIFTSLAGSQKFKSAEHVGEILFVVVVTLDEPLARRRRQRRLERGPVLLLSGGKETEQRLSRFAAARLKRGSRRSFGRPARRTSGRRCRWSRSWF